MTLMPLSEEQLAAIEARANAATHGPWMWDTTGVWTAAEAGPVLDACSPLDPSDGIGRVGDPYPRGPNNPSESMEFIAHARTDVPLLVMTYRVQANRILELEIEVRRLRISAMTRNGLIIGGGSSR